MFLGHFGLAFAARKASPSISLGALFLACQFADLLWPTLVLAGIERVEIEPGATTFTPLDFVSYPYSHSLVALILWAVIVGTIDAFGGKTARRARRPPVRERRPPRGGAMTATQLLLIVEDNPRNLKLVRDLLDHAGYRTLGVSNAEEGIELARSRAARPRAHGRPAPGHGRRRSTRAAARRARRRRDPDRRTHRLRHEGRPRTLPGGGLRRIHREAVERPRVPRAGFRDPRPAHGATA